MSTEMMRWSLGLFDRPQLALKLSTDTLFQVHVLARATKRGIPSNLTRQREHSQPHKFDRSESTSAT